MTRSIYETLSAFATDLFFNQVYDMARQTKSDEESLTNAFQRKVPQILAAMKTSPDALQTILTRYHEYARKVVPAFETMAVSEMTDRLAEQIIPKDQLGDFTVRQQDEIVEMAIVQLIRDLGAYVLEARIISLIIDQRESRASATTGMIKSRGVQILTKFRDKLYSQLYNEEVGASATVDIEDLERVQRRLEKTKEKYRDAKETIGELEEELAGAEEKIEEMAAQQKKLVRLVTILRERLSDGAGRAEPARDETSEEDGETSSDDDETSSGETSPDEPASRVSAADESSDDEPGRALPVPARRRGRRVPAKAARKKAPKARVASVPNAESPKDETQTDGFQLDELISR
jgi:exonuclease VII small subunit